VDIVRFFALGTRSVVLVLRAMVRLTGVLACVLALLFPGWAGLRSATTASGEPGSPQSRQAAPLLRASADKPFAPFVSARARTEKRVPHAPPPTGPRQVLFTFDDGPDLFTTPLVLHELDRYQMKAVFFVAGRRIMGNTKGAIARRHLLQRIGQSGHLVANHTVHHNDLCKNKAEIAFEIDHTQRLITRTIGYAPRLFRAPFGSTCSALEQALNDRKMLAVGWTIDPQDWRRQSPDKVAAFVIDRLKSMRSRAVILLHDTHLTGPQALPQILAFIDDEQARASRAEVRPLEVVAPSVLLPPSDLPPATVAPVVADIGRNLALLPGLLGFEP
jgi:peptidoglycan/xylan/chitin deacetylase (PgdA/CDA1 family)